MASPEKTLPVPISHSPPTRSTNTTLRSSFAFRVGLFTLCLVGLISLGRFLFPVSWHDCSLSPSLSNISPKSWQVTTPAQLSSAEEDIPRSHVIGGTLQINDSPDDLALDKRNWHTDKRSWHMDNEKLRGDSHAPVPPRASSDDGYPKKKLARDRHAPRDSHTPRDSHIPRDSHAPRESPDN
ncbi:hypothetical protein F5884DRAFT_27118 [Xylogone sp. PMI_703]|nr:hypothetical protein F5884DRAFT_27118 [Xylogone sp. PMI_703]